MNLQHLLSIAAQHAETPIAVPTASGLHLTEYLQIGDLGITGILTYLLVMQLKENQKVRGQMAGLLEKMVTAKLNETPPETHR